MRQTASATHFVSLQFSISGVLMERVGKLVHVGPELVEIAQTSLKAWNKKKASSIYIAQCSPSPTISSHQNTKKLDFLPYCAPTIFGAIGILPVFNQLLGPPIESQGTMEMPPMSRSKCLG